MDSFSEVLEEMRLDNDPSLIRGFLLELGDEVKIACESTVNWIWFHELAEGMGG